MNNTRNNHCRTTSLRTLLIATALTLLTGAMAAAQSTTSNPAANPSTPPDDPSSQTLRIGVSIPAVDFGGTFDGAAEALQTMLTTSLQGPGIEVIPLEARVPILLTREAQQKRVDYVVTTELTRKAGGSSLWSKVRRGATSAALVTPAFGALGNKVSTAVAVSTALQTVSVLDGAVQAKDSVKLKYGLQKGDGALAHQAELEARATATGEAVVQQLLQQMAVRVVEIVVTGKVEPSAKIR